MGGTSILRAAIFTAMLPAFAAVPDDVPVRVFVKPTGSRLELLIRLPMVAFGEIQFPTREGGNYLNVPQVEDMLPGVGRYWLAGRIEAYENGARLPKPDVREARMALESDPSFASYDAARAHLTGSRLDPAGNVFWRQAWADFFLEAPIQSDRSGFSVRLDLAHLGTRVHTELKFVEPGGQTRTFAYEGDAGVIRFQPAWYQSIAQFFHLGVRHFVHGGEYFIFVFCLILPLRTSKWIGSSAAGFAIASSVTLIASATGLAPAGLWFPPLIETAIAVNILYLALANIAGWVASERRAALALVFGLVYGFSFWFGLKPQLQFGGDHSLVAAASFDAGVMLALSASIVIFAFLVRWGVKIAGGAVEILIPSILAAHTAWHWMTDGWDRLARFRPEWPVIDAEFLAIAFRWMMILVLLFGGARFFSGWMRSRPTQQKPAREEEHAA